MSRELTSGTWSTVKNKAEHDKLTKGARVCRGEYVGPGKYLVLDYQERCPRNCCYDYVLEAIPATEVVDRIKEKILELADILKEAKKV